MKYGFIKCAAVSPKIKVGDVDFNASQIIKTIKACAEKKAEIVVLPELCVTGYTAMDLFFSQEFLSKTIAAVKKIAAATPKNFIAFFGAPIALDGRLYNCAVAVSNGKVLGVTPKTELPDYGEFYEKRYFTPAFDGVRRSDALDCQIGNIIYVCGNVKIGCEICEDLWADCSPSVEMQRAGAVIIANLSASNEIIGKAEYRRTLVTSASGKLRCCYIYADAYLGESSTDVVFSGHNIIAENGVIIAESEPFTTGEAITDIDVERVDCERRKIGLKQPQKQFAFVNFELNDEINLSRKIDKYPFVPNSDLDKRAELILSMQSQALKTRMECTKSKAAVLGVSGGLDSTLALLVCNRACPDKVMPITMPAFGTSKKTRENVAKLTSALKLKLTEIDIKNTVTGHLADLNHTDKDVTYENAQARTRTMTLFDMANKVGGLVVGTGDLSELALGWTTYNGDHMSSYCVNCGVPKTLVKFLVAYEGKRLGGDVKKATEAVLNTEISPELLPTKEGEIAQKTEEILGKYDLTDFIMYYAVRYGFGREKIEFLLKSAFNDTPEAERQKALNTFYTRFSKAQFKRSCSPDGVKIGTVGFSPRSDFRLPSDL